MKKWIALSTENGLRWRKPILKVGDFKKDSTGEEFSFSQEHIDFFAESFEHKIPVPAEHTTDPDKNRGWVVKMSVEGDTLYGDFEFSEELVPDPNIYDTSVNIPVIDGRAQAIDHVALTSYPVVKGLGTFEAISCSLISKKEKETVDWKTLATALSLSELTEDNAAEVLTKAFKSLSEEIENLKNEKKALELSLSENPKIDIKDVKEKNGKVIKLALKGRKTEIAALPLSKAAKGKLEKVFCSEDAIALSLNHETFDTFEEVVEAISEHDPLDFEEITGVQLSDRNKGGRKENGLLADAKARAEAFAKRSI
jgi:hypothetical protein